jgi:SPP1 family predicted phage head-tail adaptor
MLLREDAVLRTGGGTDSNGNPIPAVDVAIRAEFAPLTAEESYSAGRTPSSVSYRMVFMWPDQLKAATAVTWRGKLYQFVGPSMLHTIRGQVHHQEAVISRTTG